MEIKYKKARANGIKFVAEVDSKEVGSAFLYLMHNDAHKQPFGLIEYVFVDESCRRQGIGTGLVNKAIKEARKQNCYKLIVYSRYSRPKVHVLYKRLGFKDWGKEFRMDL